MEEILEDWYLFGAKNVYLEAEGQKIVKMVKKWPNFCLRNTWMVPSNKAILGFIKVVSANTKFNNLHFHMSCPTFVHK